jgi:hypothetical protein
MSPAQHLRLDLLRSTAYDVLLDLDTEQEQEGQLATQLLLTILAIDAIAPPLTDKPVSPRLSS